MSVPKLAYTLIVAIILSGCTNLAAVKQYSDTANHSLAQVPAVFKDFSGSCKRRAEYVRDKYKPNCNKLQNTEKPLKEVISVLQTYIQALGKIADDKKVTFSKDFGSLEKELKGLDKFNADQVSAVSAVAKYLSNLAADGYRRDAVKTALRENDEQVKTITAALTKIIQEEYKDLLELEKAAAIKHYGELKAMYKKTEPLAVMIKMEEREIKLAEIQKRTNTIKPLTKLLKQVQEGHHQLTEQSDTLDSEEVIELVKGFVKDSKPVIKLIKDAYQ